MKTRVTVSLKEMRKLYTLAFRLMEVLFVWPPYIWIKIYGVEYLWLDARESAVEFYRRFGFAVLGERFYKKDVPYLKMDTEL